MYRSLSIILGVSLFSGAAHAGGIDRSGQNIDVLFERGNYLEFSARYHSPSISGVGAGTVGSGFQPTPDVPSGNIGSDLLEGSFAYKHQINKRFSFAIIADQPYGVDTNYPAGPAPTPGGPLLPAGSYFANGSYMDLNSFAITALLRYKFDDNFSVHGGLRYQSLEFRQGLTYIRANPSSTVSYAGVGVKDYGLGFVAGVAYERSEQDLRVSITYSSEISHDIRAVEGPPSPADRIARIDTPQSVNLNFTTRVAPDTHLFGSARWVDWSDFTTAPAGHPGPLSPDLFEYSEDTISYMLGLEHRFDDTWSGFLTVGYEAPSGGYRSAGRNFTSEFYPVNGYHSLGVGATYTRGALSVTGDLQYVRFGDADTTIRVSSGTASANFRSNSAVTAGFTIGYRF